jgi:hypothetical protein
VLTATAFVLVAERAVVTSPGLSITLPTEPTVAT